MNTPDLIARTCGFIGVFIALIVMGICDKPSLIVTPQQNFADVTMMLQVSSDQDELTTAILADVTPEQPLIKPEPRVATESVVAPEAVVEPVVEPEALVEPEAVVEPEVTEVAEHNVAEVEVTEPEPVLEAIKPPEPIKQDLVKPEPEPQPQAQADKKKEEEQHAAAKKAEVQRKAAAEAKRKAAAEAKRQAEAQSRQRAAAQAADEQARQQAAEQAARAQAAVRQSRAQLSAMLVREIKNKMTYPKNAVRRKIQGTVEVEFVVSQGIVVSFTLVKSSGHKILDEAARKLAKSLLKLNTNLPNFNNRVLIPIKYELI